MQLNLSENAECQSCKFCQVEIAVDRFSTVVLNP